MPKVTLRAALIAAAALAAILAGTIPLVAPRIAPALAQEAEAQPTPPAATTETKPDPNQVVARINGADVTRQQVLDSAADLPDEIRSQIDLVFPQLVDRYISLILLAEKGRAEKFADDPEVRKRVARYEDEVIGRTYLSHALEQRMTDDAIKSRYEQWVKENPPPEEVRAAHILVKTEEEAKAIIEQLTGGADFATVAKEKSTDKGSGANGGELGWFVKDVMVKEFADAAFAMKVDEISAAPVKSQFGYHIIKLEERRTQPVPTLEERRREIQAELVEQIAQAVVLELRKDAKVEVIGPDGTLIEGQ